MNITNWFYSDRVICKYGKPEPQEKSLWIIGIVFIVISVITTIYWVIISIFYDYNDLKTLLCSAILALTGLCNMYDALASKYKKIISRWLKEDDAIHTREILK